MVSSPAPTPAPTEAPKPANPEPLQEPIDPEKGRVKSPTPGRSEHAQAHTLALPG
jgi:hypothetical protein